MSGGGYGGQSFQPYGQSQSFGGQNPWQRSQYGAGNKMGYQGQSNPASFYDPMKGPQSTVQNQMPQTGGPFNPMIGGGYMAGRGPGPQTGGMEPKPTYTLGQGAPIYAPTPGDPYSETLQGWSGSGISDPNPQVPIQQNGSGMAKPMVETGVAGMGSAAMNDPNLPMMYRQQAQAKGIWQPPGMGNPNAPAQPPAPPQNKPFDPRAFAGQTVTPEQAWYYGQDAIGRKINNQGDAYASFSNPADGFARTRGYFGG